MARGAGGGQLLARAQGQSGLRLSPSPLPPVGDIRGKKALVARAFLEFSPSRDTQALPAGSVSSLTVGLMV